MPEMETTSDLQAGAGGPLHPTAVDDATLRELRRKHRGVERAVRILGALVFLRGLIAGVEALAVALDAEAVQFAVTAATAAALIYGGLALYHLLPAGRLWCTVLLGLGFAADTLQVLMQAAEDGATAYTGGSVAGLLVGFALLAGLWSPKVTVVLSPLYREVVLPAVAANRERRFPWVTVTLALGTALFLAVLALVAHAPE